MRASACLCLTASSDCQRLAGDRIVSVSVFTPLRRDRGRVVAVSFFAAPCRVAWSINIRDFPKDADNNGGSRAIDSHWIDCVLKWRACPCERLCWFVCVGRLL